MIPRRACVAAAALLLALASQARTALPEQVPVFVSGRDGYLDARTGTVWVLTHNIGSDTQEQILRGTSRGTRTVWVTRSSAGSVAFPFPPCQPANTPGIGR